MATLQEGIWNLYNIGVLDVLLPFLLIFTVVFAVMQKSKILGEESKRYNIIVALVMGLSVIFPHVLGWYPPYADPVNIINGSLPSISVVVVAILMIMLLLGVFGAQWKIGSGVNTWILIVSTVTVVYVFLVNSGFFGLRGFPVWLWFLSDPATQSLLVMILVFGLIIYFITKEDKPQDENKDKIKDWIMAIDKK